jgi:TRAP-type uncharacterized transport system fused permease subunit
MGITILSAGLSKFFLVEMRRWEQVLCVAAAILMVAPSLTATLIGVAMIIPMLLRHLNALRLQRLAT